VTGQVDMGGLERPAEAERTGQDSGIISRLANLRSVGGKMVTRIVTAVRGNIVAWLALFVALSGTSLAASHYLINSTKQINPKVLRKLKGNTGATGARGSQGLRGLTGAQGTPGTPGAPGTNGTTGAPGTNGTTGSPGPEGPVGPRGVSALGILPSAQSESGVYNASRWNANEGAMTEGITFPIPLATGTANFVYTTTTVPASHCIGVGHADPGYLCIYSDKTEKVKTPPHVFTTEEPTGAETTGRFGFALYWFVTGQGLAHDYGSYTVTAP
jgi:collagen triple helix repeat protein